MTSGQRFEFVSSKDKSHSFNAIVISVLIFLYFEERHANFWENVISPTVISPTVVLPTVVLPTTVRIL